MPFIDIEDENLFYTESLSCEQSSLVLIHGSGGTHRHWPEGLRPHVGASVYAVDLPGHGRSGGESRSDVKGYARVIDAFVRKLAIKNVTLAGHSLGGAVVQVLALQSAEWLSRIVLVGTGCRLRVLPEVLDGLMTDYENTIDLMIQMMFGPDAEPALVGAEREIYLGMSPKITHDDLTACNAFDVSERLDGIRCPTLVVSGEKDRLTPVKYSEFLHRHIPNSQLTVIDRAGHMMALEKPREIAELFGSFIE